MIQMANNILQKDRTHAVRYGCQNKVAGACISIDQNRNYVLD